MDRLQLLRDAGQSVWIDDITRSAVNDGSLARYIQDLHITGLTSNPTILNNALNASADYDDEVRALGERGIPDDELFFTLALTDLTRAADMFRPAFDLTDGVDGWVSLEVSPVLADAAAPSFEQAQHLHRVGDRDNLYIKIPGTPAGVIAIEESIFAGIPINVTLLFSKDQYVRSAEAYLRGIERRIEAGRSPRVSSVASLFVSRWDRAVADNVPAELRNRLGIAVAGEAFEAYLELLHSDRWLRLANRGARPQRLLWGSTGTKDPNASDVLYVEGLIAPFTINTMPLKTLLAFADHGEVHGRLPADASEARAILQQFRDHGFDLDAIATRLQVDGAADFVSSWTKALDTLARKREALGAHA